MSQARPDSGTPAVYLDHAATSPLRPEVRDAMAEAVGEADFNPASPHGFGQRARHHLEGARRELEELLGAPRGTVHFTGGGTQSDNLAVLGFGRAHGDEGARILVSAVEHKAVLGAAKQAAREGAAVERVPVEADGRLRLDVLEELLAEGDGRPTLVSVMWANNEVGTVQPVAEAADLAHHHDALFHTDAVQALGKCGVSLEEVPADLLTVTAHKLGGPVGVGLLHRRDGVELEPLTHGGSQEGGLWPGTQDPLSAVGFARAARLATDERPAAADRWVRLRDELEERLRAGIPDLRVHGGDAPERLPNVLSVGLPGCETSALLVSLDMEGVAASSGSACSSGSASPSHVLEAMGVHADAPDDYAVLRFSLGSDTGAADVERAADVTLRAASRLRGGTAARA